MYLKQYASEPSEDSMLQFRINTVSHQYLFQTLYPKLASRKIDINNGSKKGAILFTSSVASFIKPPGLAVYAATKSYFSELAGSLATEADGLFIM